MMKHVSLEGTESSRQDFSAKKRALILYFLYFSGGLLYVGSAFKRSEAHTSDCNDVICAKTAFAFENVSVSIFEIIVDETASLKNKHRL